MCGQAFSQDFAKKFRQDTARVEQEIRDMLETDYSTAGMIFASGTLETAYDKLLNKYYTLLSDKLNDRGKKTLREAQLNWIKSRDADKKLISELYEKAYTTTGGGTIWRVIAANAMAQITRERVFVLYNYLMFSELTFE
jgi:uncharacterized protein YecT (DUF1311 family)